jgi:hypothetical protein
MGGQKVGIWDPATNMFTPVFTTPDLAGGVAWDSSGELSATRNVSRLSSGATA